MRPEAAFCAIGSRIVMLPCEEKSRGFLETNFTSAYFETTQKPRLPSWSRSCQ